MRRTWRPAVRRQVATEREAGVLPGGIEVVIFPFYSHGNPIDLQGRLCTSLHMSRADGPRCRNSCITPSQSTEKASTPARRQHPRGCNSLSHWPPVFNHLVRNTKQSRISSSPCLQTRPASLRSYFSSSFLIYLLFVLLFFFTCSFLFCLYFRLFNVFKVFSNSESFLQIGERLLNSWTL